MSAPNASDLIERTARALQKRERPVIRLKLESNRVFRQLLEGAIIHDWQFPGDWLAKWVFSDSRDRSAPPASCEALDGSDALPSLLGDESIRSEEIADGLIGYMLVRQRDAANRQGFPFLALYAGLGVLAALAAFAYLWSKSWIGPFDPAKVLRDAASDGRLVHVSALALMGWFFSVQAIRECRRRFVREAARRARGAILARLDLEGERSGEQHVALEQIKEMLVWLGSVVAGLALALGFYAGARLSPGTFDSFGFAFWGLSVATLGLGVAVWGFQSGFPAPGKPGGARDQLLGLVEQSRHAEWPARDWRA